MQTGLDRESLGHDLHLAEAAQQPAELADAELEQHRRVLVLEADLHQLRQRVQPRNPVVDLENRLAARLEDAAALVDQPCGSAVYWTTP